MILDKNKIIKTKEFIPGDGIMFNEFILHKTLSNKNGLPRISLDLRFTGREKNLNFDSYNNQKLLWDN